MSPWSPYLSEQSNKQQIPAAKNPTNDAVFSFLPQHSKWNFLHESLTQRLTRRENAAALSSGVNYNELDYDSEGKEVARL